MPQSTSRQRGGGGPGIAWVLIGGAAIAMVAATFVVGVVVGRKWPEPDVPARAASESAKKSSPLTRRSGLAEPAPERPQEKLTFYQTLTAPMGPTVSTPVGVPAKSPEPPKPRPVPERASSDRPTGAPAVMTPPKPAKPVALDERATSRAVAPAGTGDWAVQVGAFRDRTQAEAVRKQMASAGFDVYLTAVEAGPGEVRYKVRLGSFRSREDAGRVADRVRSERSLAAFVTAK
jgi:DedD protein